MPYDITNDTSYTDTALHIDNSNTVYVDSTYSYTTTSNNTASPVWIGPSWGAPFTIVERMLGVIQRQWEVKPTTGDIDKRIVIRLFKGVDL